MTKKTCFERTGKTPPSYMIERGNELAAANKKCEDKPNGDGQFYRYVKKTLAAAERKHKKKK